MAAGSTPEQDPLPLSICCVELVSKTNQVQQDEATETEMEGDVTISERGAEGVDAGGFSGAPLAAIGGGMTRAGTCALDKNEPSKSSPK